jgi:hypothetical protein
MIVRKTTRSKESRVFRRLVPIVGLIAVGLWTGPGSSPAWAQVNIDQGKSPAEMFNGDCGTCHKSAKGLANGRNSGALAGFLREHYTSSAQQAASLAAFVLGAGSGPAPGANLKPGTAAAEPKPGEAKPGEAKTGDKGRRPDAAATAKLQQPAEPDKAETAPASEAAAPGRKPQLPGKRDPRSVTASRGPRQEPEAPPPAPEAAPMGTQETAPVATAPAAPESATPANPQPPLPATAAVPGAVPESSSPPNAASGATATTSAPEAGAPGNAATTSGEETQGEGTPSENAPVPRDDIPD